MRFENKESRREKAKRWHKRYAWIPFNIDGYTIWMEYYWRRRWPSPFGGHWEYSYNPPGRSDNVVPFRRSL